MAFFLISLSLTALNGYFAIVEGNLISAFVSGGCLVTAANALSRLAAKS